MSNNKRSRAWEGLKAKGYYIALILCAVAIAVAGVVYYRSGNDDAPTTDETTPKQVASAGKMPIHKDPQTVPAIGTTPSATGDATEPTSTEPLKTMWPVEGTAVAVFAADKLAYNETTQDWRVHMGVDLSAEEGTQVMAAADGTVYTVYDDDLLGTTVVIRHEGGYVTTYASLSETVSVTAGQTVSSGDVIGTVGQTALTEKALGPHVHFSVTHHDTPIDPAAFIGE